MNKWLLAVVCMVAGLVKASDPVSEFRNLVDNRVAVRTSLGVRYARALGPDAVELALGISATRVAENPVAYRVISQQDAAYAYDKFVKPVKAVVRKELDCEAVAEAPFARFERSLVTLTLPTPMKDGARYSVVAQGAGSEMVTGAHTAGSFVYHAGQVAPAPGNAVDLAVLGLRQVMPAGNGVVKLEFGPDFAEKASAKPGNYTVLVNGKTVRIVNLGRITRIDSYLPVGWPFVAIPMHEVFLQVEPAYKDGDEITVEVSPELTTAARSARLVFRDASTFSDALKVNQVGYLTDSPVKMAYLGRWMGSFPELKQGAQASGGQSAAQEFWANLPKVKSQAEQQEEAGQGTRAEPVAPAGKPQAAMGPALAFAQEPAFAVIPESGGKPVFTGQARLVHVSGMLNEGVHGYDHSGENVYQLDFTAFKAPGRYRISVAGVGCSLPFEIGAEVYKKAFEVQAYGVFAQRCGIELRAPYSDWQRIACHKQGLIRTSQEKTAEHNIGNLPSKAIYEKIPAVEDPRAVKLDHDPQLAAHFKFDGNLSDSSGHGVDLAPAAGKASFRAGDPKVFAGGQCLGPTANGAVNGAVGTARVAISEGLSVAFWFKKNEQNKYSGFFGLGEEPGSRFLLDASWGVPMLRAGKGRTSLPALKMERPADNTWHHIAAVLDPAGKSPRTMVLYDNGVAVGCEPVGALDDEIAGRLQVGNLGGDEAGGAFFDDFRIYARALDAGEVRTLATPHPAERPVMIQAYGGHHDAGDYNPRSHYEVAQRLMNAYEMAPRKFHDGQLDIPEKGNGLPDILDEAFWALRLWMGLQDEDGGVCNGTESNGDPNFGQTVELDPKQDFAYAKDAEASFRFAGMMAQASRLWRQNGKTTEAEDFLARARRAYEWAVAHPLKAADARFFGYHVAPPQAYAAAQLLHTTREPRFNKDFRDACVWSRKPDADLEVYGQYDMQDAAWAYLMCPADVVDAAIQTQVRKATVSRADEFIRYCSTMAYAFIRHPWAPINWGTGAYENFLTPVAQAYHLTRDPKYLAWMVQTCDNTLGANPLCRSYIVGAGTRTVRAPLHNSRYSEAGEVVDGQQVEGPVQAGDGYRVRETAFPPLKDNFACLYTFVDNHFAIGMDEGVIANQVQSMAMFGLMLPDHVK